MASASYCEDLTCAICLTIFTDPVTLVCGHSFCRGCITDALSSQQQCPQCQRAVSAEVSCLPTGHILKSLAEKAKEAEKIKKEHDGKQKAEVAELCPEHEEKLKLFCVTDKQLACIICRDGESHKGHKFKPIKEAAASLRKEFEKCLVDLRGDITATESLANTQRKEITNTKERSQQLMTQIHGQFEEMSTFLRKREDEIKNELKYKEEDAVEKMSKSLNAIETHLSESRELEGKLTSVLKVEDSERILTSWTEGNNRMSPKDVFKPRAGDLEVVNTSLSLGPYESHLQFFMWKEMLQVIQPRAELLSLKSNSADITVSDDGRSLFCSPKSKQGSSDRTTEGRFRLAIDPVRGFDFTTGASQFTGFGLFGQTKDSDSASIGQTKASGSASIGQTKAPDSASFGPTKASDSASFGPTKAPTHGLFGQTKDSDSASFGQTKDSAGGLLGLTKAPIHGLFGQTKDSAGGLLGLTKAPIHGLFGQTKDSDSASFGQTKDSAGGLLGLTKAPIHGLFGQTKDSDSASFGQTKDSAGGLLGLTKAPIHGLFGQTKDSDSASFGQTKDSAGGLLGLTKAPIHGLFGQTKDSDSASFGQTKDSAGGLLGLTKAPIHGLFGQTKDSDSASFGQTKDSAGGLLGLTKAPIHGLFGQTKDSDSASFGQTKDSAGGLLGQTKDSGSASIGQTKDSGSASFGQTKDSVCGLFGQNKAPTHGLFGQTKDSAGGLLGLTKAPIHGLFGQTKDSGSASFGQTNYLGFFICQGAQHSAFSVNEFTGLHYWEIDVGQRDYWELGIKYNYLKYHAKKYSTCIPNLTTELECKGRPRKIGIYLNCTSQKLSFYNADNMTHIHTVTSRFMSKPVSAYVGIRSGEPDDRNPLTVCWY